MLILRSNYPLSRAKPPQLKHVEDVSLVPVTVDVAFGKAPGHFHLVALGDVLAPDWCGSFIVDASHVFDTALEAWGKRFLAVESCR